MSLRDFFLGAKDDADSRPDKVDSGRKYHLKMVLHFACDSRTQVHDAEGEIVRRPGESLDAMYQRFVQEGLKENGIRGAEPVLIVSCTHL